MSSLVGVKNISGKITKSSHATAIGVKNCFHAEDGLGFLTDRFFIPLGYRSAKKASCNWPRSVSHPHSENFL